MNNDPMNVAKKIEAMSPAIKIRDPLAEMIQRVPELPPSLLVKNVEDNLASEFYKRLVKWISDFNASLDDEHEVGIRLVSFGQSITFHLEDLGYSNPSLVSFSGTTDAGDPVELIQHVSQISVLLTKMTRREPDKPKRTIGFHETQD